MGMYAGMPGAERVVGAVEALAGKRGVSMAQVALAWALAKDGVSAPIVGTTSLENLRDLIGACARPICNHHGSRRAQRRFA